MDTETLRLFLKNNLLFSSEAAQILGVSRPTITNLKNAGELLCVSESSKGDLYLLQDIMKYKQKRDGIQAFLPPEPLFHSTASQLNSKWLQESIRKMGRVEQIHIYFEDKDAILDGFFYVSQTSQYGKLSFVYAPRFILIDEYKKQLWLSCATAGYTGAGSRTSERILKKLPEIAGIQIPPLSEEMIYQLFEHRRVKYLLQQDDWEVIGEDSLFQPRRLGIKEEFPARFYWYDDRLVLLQEDSFRGDKSDALQLLQHYARFIPNPIAFVYYPNIELAMEHDRFDPLAREGLHKVIYRLIIRDLSGRELWLIPQIEENVTFSRQQSVHELLKYCGFDMQAVNDKSRFSNWINAFIQPKAEDQIIVGRRKP